MSQSAQGRDKSHRTYQSLWSVLKCMSFVQGPVEVSHSMLRYHLVYAWLRQELCGITVGLSGYPQGLANKHLSRTESVTIDWNTSYKGQCHLNCKTNDSRSHKGKIPLYRARRVIVQEDQACYDPSSDFSARLLTGYDYGTPQVSSHISHGQSSQSAT